MIFRLSQKLATKVKVGTLPDVPMNDNPIADWSAHRFVADRRPFILLSNTKSLISTIMPAKGITNERQFIERSLSSIKELLQTLGVEEVYARSVVPEAESIRFATALNRSVVGSMNDMVKHVTYWLVQGDISLQEISVRLNDTPMSALNSGGSPYGFPRDVFKAMLNDDNGLRHRRPQAGEMEMASEKLDPEKAVQYVNRKGDTYYLHQGKTKTGKPKWFFSKRSDGDLVEFIPEGYEIYENYMSLVSLRLIVPTLVTKLEIEEVKAAVRDLANVRYFLVDAKDDAIIIYLADQEADLREEKLASMFGFHNLERFAASMEKRLTYFPHMRFTLIDEARRRFKVDRWCFRGSIDGWLSLHNSGDLAAMIKKYVPHLGRESFFELM